MKILDFIYIAIEKFIIIATLLLITLLIVKYAVTFLTMIGDL
jgi:hypothetical protein